MELSEQQNHDLIQALQSGYLSHLFFDGHDAVYDFLKGEYTVHGPCYEGCYLLAQALQKGIGGELYTISGHYLVTGGPMERHICVKKEDYYWDHWGRHTREGLSEFWREDNLENIKVRPFKTEDLFTVGLESPWSRQFEVLHGEEYAPLVKDVVRYFEIVLDPNKEMVNLCIWPCGTVCELADISEYTWMSDDYSVVEMPAGLNEEIFASAFQASLRMKQYSSSPDPADTLDIAF